MAFFVSSSSFASAHSVEPSSPYSSPSHEHSMSVRRGRQPDCACAPITRAISSNAIVPLLGSIAPWFQASRWLPAITS